jgi:hypothetical protein
VFDAKLSVMQLEVRATDSGEVLMRDQLPAAVVHVAVADLRSSGSARADGGGADDAHGGGGAAKQEQQQQQQLVVCLANGEVRGYVTADLGNASAATREEHDAKHLDQVRSAWALFFWVWLHRC